MPLLSAVFIVYRCCHLPSPMLSSAAVNVHRHHDPPSQPSSPLRVSAVSCRPPLSISFLVCHPILHAVVIHHCHCPPLPLSSATAVFHRRNHHHHSAVSAVSYRPLLSFPIAFRHLITLVVIICHSCYSPPLLSAIAIPPLVLPPTKCWSLHYKLRETTTTGYLWWY